jgi:ATP/maltotriose-dependent transcriptional regulator MalT
VSSPLRVERRLPLNASVTEIPALRSGVIPRAHLGPLREAAQGSRVVLISAPAAGGWPSSTSPPARVATD